MPASSPEKVSKRDETKSEKNTQQLLFRHHHANISQAHIPALVENNANILAVYSRSTASTTSLLSAAEQAGADTSKVKVYSDETPDSNLDALLLRHDINAVVIALPILVQPDVVRKCLQAGKHVLCEKPIAKDVQMGLELVREYESKYAPLGPVFAVAEQYRYDRAFNQARDIIASGTIGTIQHVHAREWRFMEAGAKYYETAWRKTPGFQGGFILDGGVHFVALLRLVSGLEIVETQSLVAQMQAHLPPVDTVNAALRFSNGALGSLSISFASSKPMFEYVFVGTEGSLTVTGAGGLSEWMKLIVETDGGNDVRETLVEGKGLYEEMKAFLTTAASGKPDKAGSPREALTDVAVIESICSGGGKIESF